MASSNFMDNKTDKELEAEMGLSESQKMSLEAIGLTRDEIKKIHAQRVLDAMVKERARLAKLEAKVRKTLPMAFAEMLEGAEDTDAVIEETYMHADSAEYMSWEEFYSSYLAKETQNTIYQYGKSKLSEAYKTEGTIRRITNVLSEQIRPKG